MPAEIHQFPCRADNYGVLVHDPATGATASVDAPDAAAVEAALAAKGWRLSDILVTHHHHDHIEGIPALIARHGARVVASRGDVAEGRVPGADRAVDEDDEVAVGSLTFHVLETPGHCAGHVSYWSPAAGVAFVGDTLFALGCGRVFGAEPAELWASLLKLRALPPATVIYCGHEYTASNARFALTVDPGNADLVARAAEVDRLRAAGQPTVPSRLADEIATNPFLRSDVPSVATAVGLAGAAPAAVFAELRRLKNGFRG
jgi:hydroxyacylglutathione hydrolase